MATKSKFGLKGKDREPFSRQMIRKLAGYSRADVSTLANNL